VSLYLILQVALTLGLLVLIGFLIHVLIQLRRTLTTLDGMLQNVDSELPTILLKLQSALDGVNSEIDRVEEIVTSFQNVRTKVENTTNLVQRAFVSPAAKASGVLSGAKVILAGLLRRRK